MMHGSSSNGNGTNGKANPQAAIKSVEKPPKPPRPQSNAYQQAIYLQRLILYEAGRKRCSGPALARLAIAWAHVEERKRILRGVPLPGQFRPDLDPVQLAKALQRQKSRQILDMQPAHRATFTDEPEKKREEKGAGEAKESLQTEGGDHGTEGGKGSGNEGG